MCNREFILNEGLFFTSRVHNRFMPAEYTRIAVIDIGSNTIKLLVADFSGGNLKQTVHCESDETRIGGYLGEGTHIMPASTIEAGLNSVKKLLTLADSHKPDQIAMIATSAVRDADNRQDFCNRIQQATGHVIQLLSGKEEAESIALGTRCDPALSDLSEFYMLDQGGGSLEIIHWSATQTKLVSLPLGAVRLFKKFLNGNTGPMSHAAEAKIREWVDLQWQNVSWLQSRSDAPWVGAGGALTLIRLLFAKRQGHNFEESSNQLDFNALSSFYSEITALNLEQRIDLARVPEARADILPAGLLAILQIMQLAQTTSLTHSVYNLRYGYALKLASQGN
ncbi:MAG: hypothetical protein AAF571_00020 [Verrucomicrobiota bacterium]